MEPERLDEAAGLLLDARRHGETLQGLPERCRPEDFETGYAIQRAFIEKRGGRGIGYKIAATSKVAQELLQVDGPFHGMAFADTTYDSPARLSAAPYIFRLIEPEFAFILGADLPARDETYDEEEVAGAVGSLHPAFEIVNSAYGLEWTRRGGPALIADNAVHAGLVLGSGQRDWRGLDLAAHAVRLSVDGAPFSEGTGAAVLGHPLTALTWLANDLSRRGEGLRAGDIVSTGLATERFALIDAGQSAEADFGALGAVEIAFEG